MTLPTIRRLPTLTAILAVGSLALTACGQGDAPAGRPADARASGEVVTVENCGLPENFPKDASRLFVNDGGMIAMALALGAGPKVAAVSSIGDDRAALERHYGTATVDRLEVVAPQMPGLETLIAQRPDVVVAGWNYGYTEAAGVTPHVLREKGMAPYVLSESCRQVDGQKARGTMEPWTALRTDLTNLGEITGTSAQAEKLNADIDRRRRVLEEIPKTTETPNVLLFDSGDKTVFTSGRFGGPQAVIDTAGARNVMDDVADTWTAVSWERVAATKPDAIVFVSYGEQTMAQKVAMLESNPATRDLDAVRQKRYLNLPYALWVSSPLNIDAAEQLRAKLEAWRLLPPSNLPAPQIDDSVGAK